MFLLASITKPTISNMTIGSQVTSDMPITPHDISTRLSICDDGNCYPSFTIRVLLTMLLVLVDVVALVGNVMLCGIVYRRSAMRSAINLLLANVAMTDFLTALLHLPLGITVLNLQQWPFGEGLCKFNGLVIMVLNCEKVIVLLAISIDRYFIIVRRCDTLTLYRSKCVIGCSWIFSLIISVPPVFGWGFYRFVRGCLQCLPLEEDKGDGSRLAKSYTIFANVIVVILPGCAFFFIYNRILRTVRRNGFRVQNHPPVTPTAMHKKGKYFIDYFYKARTSTTIFLLSLMYFLAMFPLSITNFHIAINGLNSVGMKSYIGFLIFSYMHCVASPLLYYWRIKKYRESMNDFCSQLFVFPHCVFYSGHRERRIRPHILYKVETLDNKFSITEI